LDDRDELSCEEARGVLDRDIEGRADEGVDGPGREARRLTPSGVADRAACEEEDGGPSEARRLVSDLRAPREGLGMEDRVEVGVAEPLGSLPSPE
jgi:hypothetical protein